MPMRTTFTFTRLLISIINFVLSVILIFIGLRIILRFLGANPDADFVDWIYETSGSIINPFIGMFPSPAIDGRYVIEFSSIFAFIVYLIVGYLIVELIEYIDYVSSRRVR
jgi:putative Mn2+ efflux pump MntP